MTDALKTRRSVVRSLQRWASYVFLGIVGLTMILPLAWMFLTSLKTASQVFGVGNSILPHAWQWRNYVNVWEKISFLRYYANSVIVAVVVTLGQLVFCSMAGYAFARLRFPGRKSLFFAYLATMMIPATVTMIPLFILLRSLGWLDTYAALIIPPLSSAYGTFMLRQFFLGIPRELEEAALIDGCGLPGIYYHVVLPLSKPALATLAIFAFLGNWRSFTWPLIVVSSDDMKTLPLGIAAFADVFEVNWPLLMAATMLMVLPMVAVFLFGQKYFVGGIRLGGIKG